MSNGTKNEYLRSIQSEYQKAERKEKSVILKHAVWVTGLSRKRLIRLLNTEALPTVARRRGRKLTETYQSLDPFELKARIEEKLKLFFEAIRTEGKPGEELKLTA